MYLPLNKTGVSNAITDETIYPCPSLVPKSNPSFSPFYPTIDYQNREYFSSNVSKNDISEKSNESNVSDIARPITQNTVSSTLPDNESPKVQYHIEENYREVKSSLSEKKKNDIDENLLPVMDCKFNFREICKQCILLEDHLTHNEKRCIDCCMKHFLALEGLSEEAIQLDKTQEHYQLAKELPSTIRNIQKIWHEDPQKNAHQCAQMLRDIRKKLMESCFSIVFDNSCDNGICKIKK
jgi:hypothetical protein